MRVFRGERVNEPISIGISRLHTRRNTSVSGKRAAAAIFVLAFAYAINDYVGQLIRALGRTQRTSARPMNGAN
jgi:hypothetical protein